MRRQARDRHRDDHQIGPLARPRATRSVCRARALCAPLMVAISSADAPGRLADRRSSLCAAAPPIAWPRTCRDRCCWRPRRCRGRPYAGGEIFRHWCDAARQLHVAFRVVRNGDLVAAQDLDVGRVNPDSVVDDRARTPEADRLQIRDRAHAVVRLLESCRARFGLGHVNQHRHSVFRRQRARRQERLCVDVYGECGATAGTIRSSFANSLMNASVRASLLPASSHRRPETG